MKIDEKNKFSSNNLKLAKLLIDDETFNELIKILRLFIGLPSEWIKLIDEDSNDQEKNSKCFDEKLLVFLRNKKNVPKINHAIDIVLSSYNLSENWRGSIYFCIATDILFPPDESIFLKEFIDPEVRIGDVLLLKKRTKKVVIEIFENMSITKLKSSLDDLNKDGSLSKCLNNLQSPEKTVNLSKLSNLDIKSKMLELKKNKTSLSKIAKIILTDFENNVSFDVHKSSVSAYLKRYCEILDSLSDSKHFFIQIAKIKNIKLNKEDPNYETKKLEKLKEIDKIASTFSKPVKLITE